MKRFEDLPYRSLELLRRWNREGRLGVESLAMMTFVKALAKSDTKPQVTKR